MALGLSILAVLPNISAAELPDVAALLSVRDVPFVILVMVVPTGIPLPETVAPTTKSDVVDNAVTEVDDAVLVPAREKYRDGPSFHPATLE